MVFIEYKLSGNCFVDLDTEIKYDIACARYDGVELIKFGVKTSDDEKDNKRLMTCVTKVLRSVRREGKIQFFVNPDGFANSITEAEFLLNKYQKYITTYDEDYTYIYVKT